MLLGEVDRRNKLVRIALVLAAAELENDIVVLVQHQAVLRTKNPKLVNRRPHLRRKTEIRSGALVLREDYAKLIDNIGFVDALQQRANKAVRNHQSKNADHNHSEEVDAGT